MKHSLQLPHSTVTFYEDVSEIIIEVYNETDGLIYNDGMSIKQLHDLIGTLLHIQSKVRGNGNR